MTINEELDPELVIQRLKAEVAKLKAEIRHAWFPVKVSSGRTCHGPNPADTPILLFHRMLRGETEDRGPLTQEDHTSLCAAMDAYVASPADHIPEALGCDLHRLR